MELSVSVGFGCFVVVGLIYAVVLGMSVKRIGKESAESSVVKSFVEYLVKRSRKLLFRVLREGGELPKHIAFIMDGNRRWARNHGEPDTSGHPRGSDRLLDALRWCHEAGISTVTVYAFSIENFKRPKHEVDCLMELAYHKFQDMLEKSDIIHDLQFRVCVLGDLDSLDPKLQRTMNDVMVATKAYTQHTLNICFAYTARHEIACAMNRLFEDARREPDRIEINENEVSKRLMTSDSFPDLVIRTSGERRLSDFLLWQSGFSHIVFLPVLWPDFGIHHFISAVLSYRRALPSLTLARSAYEANPMRQFSGTTTTIAEASKFPTDQ
mmetsp:Transcript_13502/g.24221  ORF Transcript_13502/g.24221 Transcript_13502/m.24221 type:complete len:325 (+) Transcript_13502:232-1206(+)